MFRLHFRKMADGADMHLAGDGAMGQPVLPRGAVPVHFAMTDEEIFTGDIKAAEKMFSGNGTEQEDRKLLDELVPPELASRLLKL
jgi:hypothetical protein